MKKIWERIVPLSRADRKWDIEFWQAQSASMRFHVTLKMIEDVHKFKGKKKNVDRLRLQRSVENLKQA